MWMATDERGDTSKDTRDMASSTEQWGSVMRQILTHSGWEINFPWTFVDWTCDTFENNLEIKHIFEKYLLGK